MRKIVLNILVLLFFVIKATASGDSCSVAPFAVVELFTSQGCSSCPPFENYLGSLFNAEEIKGRNVLYMAEHVTYWDYIGWKDPFGQDQFKPRQAKYEKALNVSMLYTPQLIINGYDEVITMSDTPSRIDAALAKLPKAGICINLESMADAAQLAFSYKLSGDYMGLAIYVVMIESGLITKVTKGENAGKTLNEDAVVRVFNKVPVSSEAGIFTITPPASMNRMNASVMAFLQDTVTMKIYGGTVGVDLSIPMNASVASNKTNDFIHPNPTNGLLYYSSVSPVKRVEISDISGKLLKVIVPNGQLSEGTIDFSSFTPGIYILSIIDSEGRKVYKLLMD